MSENGGMDNGDGNPHLASAKADFAKQNNVAFLGPPASGKTVIATLLNDSIFSSFLEKNENEYEANLTSGYEFLKETKNAMLDGKFPSTTVPENQKEAVFEIGRKGPLGKKTHLRIRDISGEDYGTLLISKDLSAETRINNILKKYKIRAMPYGPLSFVLASKMYAIVIDCSMYDSWKKYDLDYAQLLNSLLDFQKAIYKGTDKITSPIAIILAKTDSLPDEVAGSAKDQLASHMPQFIRTMQMLHSGTLEYFYMGIDLARNESNEPIPDKIKMPWSYTDDEYNRFLTWVLENM